jgi:hypothetical protein
MDYDLSGVWDSNMGFVYEFSGSGDVCHWNEHGGAVSYCVSNPSGGVR